MTNITDLPIEGIGLKENKDDHSFYLRPDPKTERKLCAEKNYEWGEYKSSLLAQFILNNTTIENELIGFANDNIQRLYDIFIYDDFKEDFKNFLLTSRADPPHNKTANKYGVGQTHISIHNTPVESLWELPRDPTEINNVVILSSFMTYQFYFF